MKRTKFYYLVGLRKHCEDITKIFRNSVRILQISTTDILIYWNFRHISVHIYVTGRILEESMTERPTRVLLGQVSRILRRNVWIIVTLIFKFGTATALKSVLVIQPCFEVKWNFKNLYSRQHENYLLYWRGKQVLRLMVPSCYSCVIS